MSGRPERSRSPRRVVPKVGGVRQRAAAQKALDAALAAANPQPTPVGDSHTASSSSSGGAPIDPDAADSFGKHVENLYLRNKFSALSTKQLTSKAQKAGAKGVAHLATPSSEGNEQRSLMRAIMRKVTRPPVYWEQIPTYDPRTNKSRHMVWIPFLLMHELLWSIIQTSGMALKQFTSLPSSLPGLNKMKASFCRKFGLAPSECIPLGLHGDGVPHSKSGTVEVFSWNFIGIPTAERHLFCCIEKMYLCRCGCKGRCTFDAIMRVFVWCLDLVMMKNWPTCRRDGSPWLKSDKWRSRMSGALGFCGGLLQVRGDWAWYKVMFAFKGWAAQSICWRCGANRSDKPFWDFSESAKWRGDRWSLERLLEEIKRQGSFASPLFGAPGFVLAVLVIDVLHCMDLGISQDALGSLFWIALGVVFKGRNRALQIESLNAMMKEFYKRTQPPSRINTVTEEMLKKTGKPAPKLRAKGGETRYLIPFGFEIAQKYHSIVNTAVSKTIMQTFSALLDFYMLMSREWDGKLAKQYCRRYCVLYGSLNDDAHSRNSNLWPIKPKMHMFQELGEFLTEEVGNPSQFWAYKDEDFVGWISDFAASRGGGHVASTCPLRVCERYRALSDRHSA